MYGSVNQGFVFTLPFSQECEAAVSWEEEGDDSPSAVPETRARHCMRRVVCAPGQQHTRPEGKVQMDSGVSLAGLW